MKTNLLYSYFSQINQEIYNFAYTLIPDSLQAGQMVVDASFVMAISEFSWAEENEIRKDEDLFRRRMKYFFLNHILKLAQKREGQLKGSLTSDLPFYNLDLNERAVLFLKHRLKLSTIEIEEIIEGECTQVLAFMVKGRQKLVSKDLVL